MSGLKRRWAGIRASVEADSRRWMVRCRKCGYERSIWELGGIKWKAKGTSWTIGRCPRCSKLRILKVYRREPTGPPPEP